MNKIKRFVAFCLAAVLFGTASVFAEFIDVGDNPYADEISFMNQLGVLNGYTETMFSPEQEFTRADFLLALMRLTKVADYLASPVEPELTEDGVAEDESVYHYNDVASHYIVDYINAAYDYGIIDDSDGPAFRPDEKITADTAMKWMVRALGYGRILAADTQIGVYGRMASEMDLLTGVSLSSTGGIRRDAGAKMLFNMMTAPLCDMRYSASDELMPATLMENYYHLKKVEGVVMAYNDLSVSSAIDAKPGQIVIGTQAFEHTTTGMESMLGLNVDAYYKADDGSAVVQVIIEDNNNESLKLTAGSNLTFDVKQREYEYYVGSSRKTAKVNADAYIVFNGMQTIDMATDVMQPNIGNVTLINNDGDSGYDIVIIESVENYYVASINSSEMEIADENGRKVCLNPDGDGIESVLLADTLGTSKQFSDIKMGNVVSVMQSRGTADKKIKAYISTATASGTITGEREDDGVKKIVVNDVEYSIDKVSATNTAAMTGRRVNIYLDMYSNVAWIKFTGAEYMYAYIVNGICNKDDEIYFLNLFMVDSEKVEFFEFADKVNIDGTSYKKEDVKTNTVLYHSAKSKFIQQLVKVKLNSENKINFIDVAVDNTSETSGYTRDEFSLDYRATSTYYRNSYLFNDKYVIANSTPVIRVPNQDIDNDVYYTDPKYFSKIPKSDIATNKEHNVALYDLDASREPAVCVIYSVKSGGSYIGITYDKIIFVSKVGYKVNDDGEVVKYLGYYNDNGSYTETSFSEDCSNDDPDINPRLSEYVRATEYSPEDIGVGFGLRALTDSFGDIYTFRVYYDPTLAYDEEGNMNYYESGIWNDDRDPATVGVSTMYYHTIYNAVGEILEVDYNKSVIFNAHKNDDGTFDESYNRTFWKARFMTGTAKVTILEDGKYRVGSWTDLAVGDKVFARAYRAEVLEFLIFR